MPFLYRTLLLATLLGSFPGLAGSLVAQTTGMSDEKRSSLVPLQTVVTYGDTGTVLVLLENPIRPTAVTFMQLDTSAQVSVRREIPLGSDNLPEFYEQAFAWNGRLTLLTSLYYPGPRRNNLIMRQYSLPGLEEISSDIVDEVYMPYDLQIPFHYSLSPDGDELLLYGWSYTLPQDSVRLSLTVMNRERSVLSDREIKLPYTNETFNLYGALLDRDGGVYVLTEDYKGNPNAWGFNDSNLQPALLYVPPSLSTAQEYVLRPDRRERLTGLRICLGGDNRLYGLGFYNRRNRSQHEGLFAFSLNGSTRAYASQRLPIERTAYRDAGTNRSSDFEGFTIDKLWWDDGQLVWAAEKTAPDPSGGAEMLFGDLLVGRLDGINRLAWFDRLPRAMTGGYNASPMLSFQGIPYEGRYYFLFGTDTGRYPSQVPFAIAIYDDNGREELEDITSAIRNTASGLPQPMLSHRVQNDRLLIFGVKAREGQASRNNNNTRFLLQLLRAGDEYTPAQYQGYLILMPL